MDSRPLGSSEQFSGIISSEPDFSIMLAGGASRSISISDESEVDAAAFKEPENLQNDHSNNILMIFLTFPADI